MAQSKHEIAKTHPTLFIKRGIDLALATGGLLVLGLMFPVVALLIAIDSDGPVIFRTRRVGRHGRPFTMYKFRTMTADAETLLPELLDRNLGNEHMIKIPHDPRITRVGRWLRRTCLDELPQLLNILRGEMSLVGPRPQNEEEVALYTSAQRRRLDVRPGLTGLWQVTARNNPSFSEWIRLDLEYIDSWSLFADFRILLKTPSVALNWNGAEVLEETGEKREDDRLVHLD